MFEMIVLTVLGILMLLFGAVLVIAGVVVYILMKAAEEEIGSEHKLYKGGFYQ